MVVAGALVSVCVFASIRCRPMAYSLYYIVYSSTAAAAAVFIRVSGRVYGTLSHGDKDETKTPTMKTRRTSSSAFDNEIRPAAA